MSEAIEAPVVEAVPDTDLVAAIRTALESSPEPMTLSKIRSALPAPFRSMEPEALADVLRRQAAANVLIQYPKYRSPQDRFWDRPMPVHLACLLQSALQEKPLAWSELRRKLPDYAKTQAEPILEELVAKRTVHRHPPLKSRTGPRFGLHGPDPKDYLRRELCQVFESLEQLGFSRAQLREGALDLLHEEEWSSPPPAVSSQRSAVSGQQPAGIQIAQSEQPEPLPEQAAGQLAEQS